jgi:membrane associated rhomboid family serine protease
MWLIATSVATFLFYILSTKSAVQEAIERWLILRPADLLQGHVWKLVTTTFFERNQTVSLILNVLVLWMFVSTLESSWGRRRFITFFAVTTIAGNLVGGLFGILIGDAAPIFGMTAFIYASIVAYGVEWGDQPVRFFGVLPMKARTLAIGVSVIMLLGAASNGRWTDAVGWIAAMVAAIAMSGALRVWLLRGKHAWLMRSRRQAAKRFTVLSGDPDKVGQKIGQKVEKTKSGGPRWMN